MDGDVVLFEDFEETCVSDAAGEAAAECQSDTNRRCSDVALPVCARLMSALFCSGVGAVETPMSAVVCMWPPTQQSAENDPNPYVLRRADALLKSEKEIRKEGFPTSNVPEVGVLNKTVCADVLLLT